MKNQFEKTAKEVVGNVYDPNEIDINYALESIVGKAVAPLKNQFKAAVLEATAAGMENVWDETAVTVEFYQAGIVIRMTYDKESKDCIVKDIPLAKLMEDAASWTDPLPETIASIDKSIEILQRVRASWASAIAKTGQ